MPRSYNMYMTKSYRNSNWYNALLLSFLALLCLIGLFQYGKEMYVFVAGDKTQGTVVDPMCRPTCTQRHPMVKIQYFDNQGNSYFYTHVSRYQDIYPIGSSVTIYFDPKNPTTASPLSLWFFVNFLMTLTFFICVVLGIVFLTRKEKEKI